MIYPMLSQGIMPLIAYLNLLLIMIFAILSSNIIYKKLTKIKKRYLIALIIVFLAGLYIRLHYSPLHHGFFIDESFYMESAKNILAHQRSFLSTGDYEKQIGWPVLLTIPFFIFGVNNYVAIYTSVFIGSLSVFLIFVLVFLIFRNEKSALFSSVLLAVLPLHIFYSGTAETAAASIFFILLTYISFFFMLEKFDIKFAYLTLFLLLFAIQVRLENFLMFIPMTIYILIKKVDLRWKKSVVPAMISIPFFASVIFQYFQIKGFYVKAYATELAFFGFENISDKFYLFIKSIDLFYLFFIFIAVIGAYYSFKKEKLLSYFFASWFLVFSLYYLLYLFADDFHFLPALVALIPIAAFGIDSLIAYFSEYFKIKQNNLLLFSIIFILALFFISYDGVSMPYFELETRVMGKLSEDIPPDCIIVAELPNIITSTTELEAIGTAKFLNDASDDLFSYKNRCLLYFEDMYCKENFLPNSMLRCGRMRSKFKLTDFIWHKNGELGFYFYKISAKRP